MENFVEMFLTLSPFLPTLEATLLLYVSQTNEDFPPSMKMANGGWLKEKGTLHPSPPGEVKIVLP